MKIVITLLSVLAAILAQVILRLFWPISLAGGPSFINSIISGAIAIIISSTIANRVQNYPGVSGISAVVPSFIAGHGIIVIYFFTTRFPYSNYFLVLSFFVGIISYTILHFFINRRDRRRFYFVPGGRISSLKPSSHFDLVEMKNPQLPVDRRAAIIGDLHHDLEAEWESMLAQAALRSIPVYHYKPIKESLTGRVEIDHLSENVHGSLTPNKTYLRFKFVIDIVISLLLLPLLFLPLLLVAFLIRRESAGPAIFRQERIGYRGQPFTVFKFRTMRQECDPERATSRDASMTRDQDSRITKLGKFLRKTRIDELPQIVNVLRGEMSWIGPRPEAAPLSSWYAREIPFYAYRHIVRPGVTGWAQVNQGHVTDLEDITTKLQYDFYYIKNFSYWLDTLIALRSVGVVFTGFGAR